MRCVSNWHRSCGSPTRQYQLRPSGCWACCVMRGPSGRHGAANPRNLRIRQVINREASAAAGACTASGKLYTHPGACPVFPAGPQPWLFHGQACRMTGSKRGLVSQLLEVRQQDGDMDEEDDHVVNRKMQRRPSVSTAGMCSDHCSAIDRCVVSRCGRDSSC